jgi:hypothetical protein
VLDLIKIFNMSKDTYSLKNMSKKVKKQGGESMKVRQTVKR